MSKTLVIILSETRAHELTFDNFKKKPKHSSENEEYDWEAEHDKLLMMEQAGNGQTTNFNEMVTNC